MNKYILFALIVYLIFASGCIAPSGYKWVQVKSKKDWTTLSGQPERSKHIWRGQDVTPMRHETFGSFLLHSSGTKVIK